MIVRRAFLLMIAFLVIAVLASCATKRERTEADWQALAKADLDAVYQTIKDVHPGAIDELNPRFNDWVEQGYREALALIPQVRSYDEMLNAVRYYTVGFRDGHLGYSDGIRGDSPAYAMNFRLVYRDGSFVVAAVAPVSKGPIPPLGAKLVTCDGRDARSIWETNVAPFFDRRAINWNEDFPHVQRRSPSSFELKSCKFKLVSGEEQDFAIAYEPMRGQVYYEKFVLPLLRFPNANNVFELKEGVLWVRAGNFKLQGEELRAFDSVIEKLTALQGDASVRAIVFDTRGNAGGDSAFGDRIFEAATGGLDFDTANTEGLKRRSALWRVSDAAIKRAVEMREQTLRDFGKESSNYDSAERLRRDLFAAKAKHEAWVELDAGFRFDRAEVAKRGGRLRKFGGPVALLTDSNCASACLDFADLVMLTPNALHLGQTTSSDTLYIDVAFIPMPSGNGLVLPLKVWRNRLRASDEALIPSVPIELEGKDESVVRKTVLQAIAKAKAGR
jgi:Peptidase family S41